MGEVSTIGLDIAKSIFQIHGVDAAGAVVMRNCFLLRAVHAAC
jgi:transposase